jgi:hypothetical protein
MRADCFHETKRLPGFEVQAALVCVLQVVQMPLNGELNVAACDDFTAQNGVAEAVGAVRMVSGWHAGDVDLRARVSRNPQTEIPTNVT